MTEGSTVPFIQLTQSIPELLDVWRKTLRCRHKMMGCRNPTSWIKNMLSEMSAQLILQPSHVPPPNSRPFLYPAVDFSNLF